MTNNTHKQTILNLFADNVSGEITAFTMREFINAIFDDSQVIIKTFSSLLAFENATSEQRADIYEGSLVAITNTELGEEGMYVATANQPATRDLLRHYSNNSDPKPYQKETFEFTSQENQSAFACEYTDNLVDVFIGGSKVADSKVLKNSTAISNGTTVVLINLGSLPQGQLVEVVCYKKQ